MDTLLNTAVPEGGFKPVQRIKGSPVPAETVLDNIRASVEFDVPCVVRQPDRDDVLIFVAGGPTLRQYLAEIKERQAAGAHIMTSNNTHDYLVDNGIVPDSCLLFDPKKRVVDYVNKIQPTCHYYLATTVVREVWEKFTAAGAKLSKVLVAFGLDESQDINLQRELYPKIPASNYLIGGTMTPLRAMPFAVLLGFKSIEFYGFDSCFAQNAKIIMEGEPGYLETVVRMQSGYTDAETGKKYVIDEPEDGGYFYAYRKPRIEDAHVAEVDGRRFFTSPGFAYQAQQIVEWVDRLDGRLSVEIHGDSLSSCILAKHRADKAARKARIGNRRWTDAYAEMQKSMHDGEDYGVVGARSVELIGRMLLGVHAQLGRRVSMFDYGSGPGRLVEALQKVICCADYQNYDPFHAKWADNVEPGIVDVVTCMDVMEHVEEECVENVIDWIADRARYGAVFNICLAPAKKTLPDGRNAHITLKPAEWWQKQIARRFSIAESTRSGSNVVFVCSAIGAQQRFMEEKKAA